MKTIVKETVFGKPTVLTLEYDVKLMSIEDRQDYRDHIKNMVVNFMEFSNNAKVVMEDECENCLSIKSNGICKQMGCGNYGR